jgi:hypothetical protein
LNVARYRVRGHDERGVKRMDVLARHRTFGMIDQSRDGHLGKAEIVGDAREAGRRTCGVTSDSGESLKICFQWLGKLPNALSSPCPEKTYVPTSSVRRRSRYSTTGSPMGRMDSPSLLSSNRKQLASVSTSVHFKPIISLRREPVSAI